MFSEDSKEMATVPRLTFLFAGTTIRRELAVYVQRIGYVRKTCDVVTFFSRQ